MGIDIFHRDASALPDQHGGSGTGGVAALVGIAHLRHIVGVVVGKLEPPLALIRNTRHAVEGAVTAPALAGQRVIDLAVLQIAAALPVRIPCDRTDFASPLDACTVDRIVVAGRDREDHSILSLDL